MSRSTIATDQLAHERMIFELLPVPKAVAAMVVPTIVSQIISVVYNLADTWFVGLTGNAGAVAAISLCLPVYTMMSAFSNLFGIGGSSMIARAVGMKEINNARTDFSISFWAALVTAAVYSLFILTLARPFLLLIGGDSNSIDYAVSYVYITIVIGGIPTILASTFAHLIRSAGESKAASSGMMIGAVLNIVLDPLFMFVLLPNGFEVVGAAIATTVSNTVSLIYFICYLNKHHDGTFFDISPRLLKRSRRIFWKIIKCGLPSFALVGMAMISNFFLNGMIGSGVDGSAVAGMGIVRKIDSLAYAVNQGITQGMLPIVAYCYASSRIQRMKSVVLFCSVCTVGFSLVCSIISYLFAPVLISVFIKDASTIAYGAKFLRIMCISVSLYPITFIVITLFQSVGQSVKPFILSLLHKGSFDILLLFIIRSLYGAENIVWAAPVMDAVALVTAVLMAFTLFRKLNRSSY